MGLATQAITSPIPRRIHQLWKDEQLPPRHAAFAQTWKRLNPGWQYRLWTDAQIRQLVAQKQPGLLEIFDAYPNNISRADLGRYVILQCFGGVYADLDCE